MSKTKTNPKVDAVLEKEKQWKPEMEKMRAIILSCGLTEELKWGQPCYTHDDRNIVLIHGFKDYCAMLFMKGALMKDPKGLLVQQTENVQSGRQIRFTGFGEIKKHEKDLKAYVLDAIEVEKSGAKVKMKTTAEFKMPEEFKTRLAGDAKLKKAFEALTPGRQKGYLLHFGGAKQAATREARIDKNIPKIMKGKGLLDD